MAIELTEEQIALWVTGHLALQEKKTWSNADWSKEQIKEALDKVNAMRAETMSSKEKALEHLRKTSEMFNAEGGNQPLDAAQLLNFYKTQDAV